MFRHRGKSQCGRVRGMLSGYIDNCLSSGEQGIVERHLKACEACLSELESLQMTVQLVHRVPMVPAPRSFAIAEVEPRRASIFGAPSSRWLRPATVFATFVLMLLLLGDFFQVFEHEVGVGVGEVPAEPPAQTMSLPTPERGEDMAEMNGGMSMLATPEAGKEVMGEVVVGWPLRQIEIAVGVVVFVLASITIYASWQRRRWRGV